MSNQQVPTPKGPARQAPKPLIGALLRLPHEVVMARMLAALDSAGHDITPTELSVFLYPGPDGRRPADLARQCNMTRQAMNYVLTALERRGYLVRQTSPEGSTLVRLTTKGWATVDPIRACVSEIEQEWTAHLGARRFDVLRRTLHELALHLGKLS